MEENKNIDTSYENVEEESQVIEFLNELETNVSENVSETYASTNEIYITVTLVVSILLAIIILKTLINHKSNAQKKKKK